MVRERGTPHAGPPPSPLPAGGRPGLARPAPTRGANRLWNRGIARAPTRARARVLRARGPTRGASRQASPRKASERGGAGGGVSKGLERVLSKTGPRTKRNPQCELADRRRLLLLPWQAAVSPQDSASRPPVCVCVRSGARPGWSEVTAHRRPLATRDPTREADEEGEAASARRDTRPSRVAPRGSPGCG